MEAVAEEVRSQVDDRPFLSDPYLDWAEAQNIPIVEDFGIHLPDLPVSPWEHFECNGGLAHLKGRGDWLSVFVLELPPGGNTRPRNHMFEEVYYVLSGTGSTQVELSTVQSIALNGGRAACSLYL